MAGRIRFFEIFYEILCVAILALNIHIIKIIKNAYLSYIQNPVDR